MVIPGWIARGVALAMLAATAASGKSYLNAWGITCFDTGRLGAGSGCVRLRFGDWERVSVQYPITTTRPLLRSKPNGPEVLNSAACSAA